MVSQKVALSFGVEYLYPNLKDYIAALMQPKVGNKRRSKNLSKHMQTLTDVVSEVLYNFSK